MSTEATTEPTTEPVTEPKTTRTVHALLVGIDAYTSVPALQGCVNDIDAIDALLRARVADTGDDLRVQRLVDADATREAFITAMRSLATVGKNDVVLVYYSGHGSQEDAPQEWWDLEPDHLNETLVLHDSRDQGKRDLADKELAHLLTDVTEAAGHVLVVLDCCHSGSGTRATLDDGTASRRAPADRRPRPIDDYLFPAELAHDLAAGPMERSALGDSGWALPGGAHVLLAGCRSNETSKEVAVEGVHRGAMSLALERVLTAPESSLTYREIHRQVSATVRTLVRQQAPQLEGLPEHLAQPFLGGAVTSPGPWFVLTRDGQDWVIDGGLLHGIAAPVGDEHTVLEVRDSSDQPVGTARVSAARAGDSTVTVEDGVLDPGKSYRALVVSTPMPPLLVRLSDGPGETELREALGAREKSGPLIIREAGPAEAPYIAVAKVDSGYSLGVVGSERELAPHAESASAALTALEQIAAWRRLVELHHAPAALPADAITVELRLPEGGPPAATGGVPAAAGGPPAATGGVPAAPSDAVVQTDVEAHAVVDGAHRITYLREPNGDLTARPYTVTLTNTSDQTLWVALLDLTDTFGIYADAFPEGSISLAPNQSKTTRLTAEVPDDLWKEGLSEVTDVLKVVASTESFDPRPLQQGDLDVTRTAPATRSLRSRKPSGLDLLLDRVTTRRARPQSESERAGDWFTTEIRVVSVRPQPDVSASPDQPGTLASGVTLAPHPSLRAKVRLSSAPDATRDLSAPPVPEALQLPGVVPFALAPTRGGLTDTDAVVITLDAGSDPGVVTRQAPLVLRLDQSLAAGEHVIPFAWDGEYFVPLGHARPAAAGSGAGTRAGSRAGTEIVIERLTAPVVTQRDLFGSIRILFRKLVGNALGLPPAYPVLRLTTVGPDGEVHYDGDQTAVRDAVQHADAVLLYVHGIIGDTRGMARSSLLAGMAEPIGSRYGAILSFDYENLDTPIGENAAHLKKLLLAAGLGSGHGKRFDVVAHSMGGLVSRHLIEVDGGVDVTRLVTLGTPNGGSPWSDVQHWATVVLGLAANHLTAVAWPVAALAGLMGLIEKVDTALDEMQPGSDFLKELGAAQDPKVEYHVLVGDRSLVQSGATTERVQGLLSRISPARLGGKVVDLVFLGKPNDLAVSVASAQQLPAGRSPAPVVDVLATDHVSFFEAEPSLVRLAEVLS